MRAKLLPEGNRFLAEVLAGADKRINGMYVEYGPEPLLAVGERSPSYFEELLRSPASGYGRIAVQNAVVNDNNTVTFTGLITSADMHGGKPGRGSLLLGATLVWMPDDLVAHDVPLYSALFSNPIRLVKGAYTTVSVTLAIRA